MTEARETPWTPGPWRIDDYPQASFHIIADEKWVMPTLVASIVRGSPDGQIYCANARLIAAAPELYSALDSLLKTIVDDLGECGYEESDIDDHDGVKLARSALATARGET